MLIAAVAAMLWANLAPGAYARSRTCTSAR